MSDVAVTDDATIDKRGGKGVISTQNATPPKVENVADMKSKNGLIAVAQLCSTNDLEFNYQVTAC